MDVEMDALLSREIWDLVDRASHVTRVTCRWVLSSQPGSWYSGRSQDNHMADRTPSTPMQLIDEHGELNRAGLNSLVAREMYGEASYTVVSILGPQSSGKSTLLNHLYGAKFDVMNAAMGRCQTTRGIYLAKSKGELIMDVEGSDSGEREGHQSLEQQLAAFSFAISRIILVNMSNNDVGRHVAGCTELLEMALEFMECYLHHHKFTVIFVVRDKDPETPFSKTEENLFHTIEKIWNNIKKSDHLQQRSLNCFDVQVYTMSDYQYQKNEFLKEVEILRMRIKEIVSGRGRHEYSAPKFAAKVQEHWSNIIRAIDIPTYKVAIAYQRCDEIAKECIVKFEKDLKDMRQKESIKIFPFKVERSIQYSLEQYDKESIYFDKSLTSKHRGDMKCELLKCAEHAFGMTLPALHPQQVMSFGKCVRKRLENVGDSTRSGREIIEDCITDYMDIYHACCIGLVVPGARWDVHVSDHSLRRALQQKAKEAHEAVALPRRIIVTAKKISIGVMSPLFPVTFPAMGVSGYKLYKSHKFLEKLGDYDPEEPSTAS